MVELNISKQGDKTFKAACIIIWALNIRSFDYKELCKSCPIANYYIKKTLSNLVKYELLYDGVLLIEGDELGVMEFTLISMCAAGVLHREVVKKETYPLPVCITTPYQFFVPFDVRPVKPDTSHPFP